MGGLQLIQLNMDVVFPATGCYLVKPKRYFDRFDAAKNYIRLHRNVQPAIYNERRVRELPIPNIEQDDSDDDSDSDLLNYLRMNESASDAPAMEMINQLQLPGKISS